MKLLVPAYVYPAADPGFWSSLIENRDLIGAVVVNPGSGVGMTRDCVWVQAVEALREAGITTLGYLDLAYGARTVAELTLEATRWKEWFGVDGYFLDCMHSQSPDLPQDLVPALRALGVDEVVGNPGCPTSPRVSRFLDVVLDFEGLVPPEQVEALPLGVRRAWICHSLTGDRWMRALADAQEQRVDTMWLTDRTGTNPYDSVPTFWADLLTRIASPPTGASCA